MLAKKIAFPPNDFRRQIMVLDKLQKYYNSFFNYYKQAQAFCKNYSLNNFLGSIINCA